MKINGKSLRGLFEYDPTAEFERGDFVIEGLMIYNCIADSINESPSLSPNFTPYMAGEIATLNEILEGKGENKFVSVELLSRLLDHYFSGFSAAGLITNEISDNGDITLRDMLGNRLAPSLPANYTDPLDKILYSNINNGIFKVSRVIAEYLIGSGNEPVILRQFSYKDGEILHKTQELVDEENGRTMYRHLVGQAENPTKWKFSLVGEDVSVLMSDIANYYKTKVQELETEKTRLRSCFRFEEVTDNHVYSDNDILTFTVKDTLDNDITTTHSATIKVKTDGVSYKYKLGNKVVTVTCDERGVLTINGAEVLDKYIRKRYD